MQLGRKFAATVAAILSNEGWQQTDEEEPQFDYRMVPEVICGLSLNLASQEYGVACYAALGVRPTSVDGLYTLFRGLPRQSVASVGIGLADLLFRSGQTAAPINRWFAGSETEVDAASGRLHSDLIKYGMPYFYTFSSVHAIVEELERTRRSPNVSAHLALAYAAVGDLDKASQELLRYLELAKIAQSVYDPRATQFVSAFAAHFNLSRAGLI